MSGLDLYQTQSALWLMLVWGAATGFCLGVVYDLLRALRILTGLQREQGSTPLFRVALFFEDLLLALAAAVAWILLCYYANDGRPRAPAFWGMASGFFVYTQTVGRLTFRIEKALARLLKRLIRAVLPVLYRPLARVTAAAGSLVRRVWRGLFGKAVDKARVRRLRRQTQKRRNGPTEPVPRKGTTVFSTRGRP